MTDLFSKFDALIAQREGLLATGVKDPFSLVMEEVNNLRSQRISRVWKRSDL
jgi:glycine C-acetyltransferase/8-amino-7-oxononanoate synthase